MEADMDNAVIDTQQKQVNGPPRLREFAHVSVPCRDLEEGKLFYAKVLGAQMHIEEKSFASFKLAGVDVGIGAEGCSFIETSAEYPHFAFYASADEMLHMKAWLTRCGIPSSNFWTRGGVEALMFFRDPSGNMIELFCLTGFKGAEMLPRGPARGHGTAVDIESLRYTSWKLPE
jgi:catechol 2,3-dioxygenase-like lactoylglutathione lyase family enzyme